MARQRNYEYSISSLRFKRVMSIPDLLSRGSFSISNLFISPDNMRDKLDTYLCSRCLSPLFFIYLSICLHVCYSLTLYLFFSFHPFNNFTYILVFSLCLFIYLCLSTDICYMYPPITFSLSVFMFSFYLLINSSLYINLSVSICHLLSSLSDPRRETPPPRHLPSRLPRVRE